MVNTVHIPKKFVKLQSDTEIEKKTVADITNKLEIATLHINYPVSIKWKNSAINNVFVARLPII